MQAVSGSTGIRKTERGNGKLRVDVVTVFPEWMASALGIGILGRARERGLVEVVTWDPRDFTADRHRRVDDRPYGGGPGMVMLPEPLDKTLRTVRGAADEAPVSYLTPAGRRLDHGAIRTLSERRRLILLCGRYEGVDQRFLDEHVEEEWSIGDYVLSGGELAAAVVVEAVARLLPGVLGDEQSAVQDSFVDGLLDCPHYTRPDSYRGREVPAVLTSGDHAAVARWRRKQQLGYTWQRRPDLLRGRVLERRDRCLIAEFLQELRAAGHDTAGRAMEAGETQ